MSLSFDHIELFLKGESYSKALIGLVALRAGAPSSASPGAWAFVPEQDLCRPRPAAGPGRLPALGSGAPRIPQGTARTSARSVLLAARSRVTDAGVQAEGGSRVGTRKTGELFLVIREAGWSEVFKNDNFSASSGSRPRDCVSDHVCTDRLTPRDELRLKTPARGSGPHAATVTGGGAAVSHRQLVKAQEEPRPREPGVSAGAGPQHTACPPR